MIDVGGQGSPQQIYFGTEYRAQDVSRFVVPLEAVAATFFTLVALTFIGLGQTMGRAFDSVPDRVTAYTVNIAGSLFGIAAMAALSYLETPPADMVRNRRVALPVLRSSKDDLAIWLRGRDAGRHHAVGPDRVGDHHLVSLLQNSVRE